MKKGTKVKTWTSHKIGVVQRVNSDGTVDVKYKGSPGVDTIPISMCVAIGAHR